MAIYQVFVRSENFESHRLDLALRLGKLTQGNWASLGGPQFNVRFDGSEVELAAEIDEALEHEGAVFVMTEDGKIRSVGADEIDRSNLGHWWSVADGEDSEGP